MSSERSLAFFISAFVCAILLATGLAGAAPSLSTASYYGCVRTSDGHVACWSGATEPGAAYSSAPQRVYGLSDVAGVAAGEYETCVWHQNGRVACWPVGGSLHTAAQVPDLTEVVEVAAEGTLTCARRSNGHVSCWAADFERSSGRLLPPKPHEIAGIDDALEVVVADTHACARRESGTVSCWSGDKPSRLREVRSARGARHLAGGSRWNNGRRPRFVATLAGKPPVGWNADGSRWALLRVPDDVERFALGPDEVCALGRSVTCWGYEVGSGNPYTVPDSTGASEVSVGNHFGCFVSPDRHVRCWGERDRLGAGITRRVDIPVAVTGIDDAVQLEGNGGTTCARRSSGKVACWGVSFTRELGPDRSAHDSVPVDIVGAEDAVDLAVSGYTACVRTRPGKTLCWGDDPRYPRTTRKLRKPTAIPELAGIGSLVFDGFVLCGARGPRVVCSSRRAPNAPKVNGLSEAWHGGALRDSYACARGTEGIACTYSYSGRHDDSEAGPDDEWGDLSDVVDLRLPGSDRAAYFAHADGQVVRFERGKDGHAMVGVSDVVQLAQLGEPSDLAQETCALRKNGEVLCWRELDTPPVLRSLPGLTDITRIVGDGPVACALGKTGRVWCWGEDRDLLGDGGSSRTNDPVVVPDVSL